MADGALNKGSKTPPARSFPVLMKAAWALLPKKHTCGNNQLGLHTARPSSTCFKIKPFFNGCSFLLPINEADLSALPSFFGREGVPSPVS